MKAKRFLASALKFVLLSVVAAFLALHSINLFRFVFPADQQYLAWLGFGLTGFGAIAYLIMFLWEGSTVLQRSVSLAMAVICSIGEVLAALFGMQIESWTKAGFTLTENDFTSMLMVIGLLSIAHFFALIAYFAGDKIGELFADEDKNGIPDAFERKNKKHNPQPAFAQTVQQPQHSLDELVKVAGMGKDQLRRQYADRDAFMEFAAKKFDYISGGNMRRMHGELMGQGNGSHAGPTQPPR
jgi:hypothetical protein